jgi:uncharacterized protein (DUF2225 family)
MTVSTARELEQETPELEERFTHSGWYKRQCMIAELAMGDLSYRQIGQKYGKTENNVQQFAWYYKKEIAEERARFYAELRLRCNGEKQYRVKVLKEIIEELNERLVEFAEVCNRLDLQFLEDQAVWNNYHAASCRYRELQADIIRQIKRSWTLKPAVHVKRPK